MVKKSFSENVCSLAQALDVIGEWWSMLIIRDFFLGGGVRRFEQLRDSLGISRNILTERLKTLTDAGVIKKVPLKDGGRRQAYKLTEKGVDLMPTLVAMMQWGDRWRDDPEARLVTIRAKSDKRAISPLQIHSRSGEELQMFDMYATVSIHGEEHPVSHWPPKLDLKQKAS